MDDSDIFHDFHEWGTRVAIGGPASRADPASQAILGPTRYETSVATARHLFAKASVIGVASGTSFSHPLSGSAHVRRVSGPMLLTAPRFVPDAVRTYAAELDTPSIYVYGGPAAVTDTAIASFGGTPG